MNKDELKSKLKYTIIISLIGFILSFGCLIYEIISKGNSITFWVILLTCNTSVMIANIVNYKKIQ